MAFYNPFAFRPAQVTFWTTAVYLALLSSLIYIHENVPRAPQDSALPPGLSLSEAWHDLANLTREYHPFNSRSNDAVRVWLLVRLQQILDQNSASWTTERDCIGEAPATDLARKPGADAVVFNDLCSNVTFNASALGQGAVTYFQGSNVYVLIRGSSDEEGEWWDTDTVSGARARSMKGRCVLVNSHFDSVASAYGATDDGVGVISGLQLVKYFTAPGNVPRRCIVVLFNNGEEDGLFGAYVFVKSKLFPFIGTFLNLEGAGAGGRAALFRTTDLEVTAAYRGTSEPFGSVIGTDGFKMGWIRSETDYRVWAGSYGWRGLDMAFYAPRARYHTRQDDRRHTSKNSIWHMLSGALTTTINLSGDIGDAVQWGNTPGVWFDLFGDSLVLFALKGMFAWSLTILVAAPLILILLAYVIRQADKDYIFASKVDVNRDPGSEKVPVDGMKGFSRFPVALVVAGALVFGAAFLLRKLQPFIIYSSPYAVWAMMLSLCYFSFWCVMRGANFARPSALHRAYVHIWLFVLAWAVLVAVTVTEDRMQIASGYLFVFWASQVFVATLVSTLELFGLPKKRQYAQGVQEDHEVRSHLTAVPRNDTIIAPSPGELDDGETAIQDDDESGEGDPPNETSPLVGGDTRGNTRTTFATGYRRSIAALVKATRDGTDRAGGKAYGHEQKWSASLPSSTWFLQFLILGPFMIILTGQLGLILTSSLSQTGADGSDLLRPYLVIAAFSILLLLPVTPFIHRVTRHLPLFFLAIFAGTLIYCLAAFPFSASSPYKLYFRQVIDLDSRNSTVVLTGYEDFARMVIADLPSAFGKYVDCVPSSGRQLGLVDCSFDGNDAAPNPGRNVKPGIPPQTGYDKLVNISVERAGLEKRATIKVDGLNTKTCTIKFKRSVKSVGVRGGGGPDHRIDPQGFKEDIAEFALWRSDWETPWVVDVEWDDGEDGEVGLPEDEAGQTYSTAAQGELRARAHRRDLRGLDGLVVCRWSDANTPGVIPALDEVWRYAPSWAIVSIKSKPALVEGTKSFMA